MKQTRYRILLAVLTLMGVVALGITLTACAPKGPVEPYKSPEQVWIEAHPTHAGDAGECIEFDGELCDDDPYDLDDLTEVDSHKTPGVSKPSARPSPRPVKTAAQPKTTRRR